MKMQPEISLKGILDLRQSKQLLQSLVRLDPYLLTIVDTSGDVLVQISHPDLADEKHQQLETASDNEAVHFSLELQGQYLGKVMAISAEPPPIGLERLTATVQMIGQVLSEQIYKEYEINSLSRELLNRYEELTLLYEVSQALGAVFDINTICQIALEMALQVLAANKAFIALLDSDNLNLTVNAARGIKGFVGWKIPMGEGVSGQVADSGQTILLDSQTSTVQRSRQTTEAYSLAEINQAHEAAEATLSVPLILSTEDAQNTKGVLGVITLLGRPSGMFSAGDAKLLNTLAAQISTAIHNSQLVTALQEAERVQQQIEIAAQIQQSLLPKKPPQIPGITLVGQCRPAANVGGDYYDYVTDEEQRLTLFIADASGHSVGSALLMVTARSQLRTEIALGKSLSSILADTNRAIFEDLSQAEIFISLFCARYDPWLQQLTFVNGGHNLPLLCRATTGEIISLDSDGLILGVLDEVQYEEATISMTSGDLLVLYTDGVVEARSPQGEQFGDERLHNLVQAKRLLSPPKLIDLIYQTLEEYTENVPQQDDITLLVFKVS